MSAQREEAVRRQVLIVGIVRNVELTLNVDYERLSAAFGDEDVFWFLVESDSTDNTLHMLSAINKRNARFRFSSLGNLENFISERTQRLAACRNEYLRELRSNPLYSDVSLVCVADLDGVNRKISGTAVRRALKLGSWDACFPNQRGPYYDVWALRHAEWSPDDCWHSYEQDLRMGVSAAESRKKNVVDRMRTIDSDDDVIPVVSAFGGLGVYKKNWLIDEEYNGMEGDLAVCEHVSVNSSISRKGGKLFVVPWLINAGLTEHNFEATAVGRLLPSRISVKLGAQLWKWLLLWDWVMNVLRRTPRIEHLGLGERENG